MPEMTRRTTIETDGDHTPIRGRVIADGGKVGPFVGWMQLVQRLEHAIGGQAAAHRPPGTDLPPETPSPAL